MGDGENIRRHAKNDWKNNPAHICIVQ